MGVSYRCVVVLTLCGVCTVSLVNYLTVIHFWDWADNGVYTETVGDLEIKLRIYYGPEYFVGLLQAMSPAHNLNSFFTQRNILK